MGRRTAGKIVQQAATPLAVLPVAGPDAVQTSSAALFLAGLALAACRLLSSGPGTRSPGEVSLAAALRDRTGL